MFIALYRGPAALEAPEAFLCFHGTTKLSCEQIAKTGFDASRRSSSLEKIVPYLPGVYLSSEASVALKYSRQKELRCKTLSVLLVQVAKMHFELRNGVWFQRLDDGVFGPPPLSGAVDLGQSTTLVCDERALLPRAILTFRPAWATENSSAMAAYDVAARRSSRGPWRQKGLPSAVLFDLDMTLGATRRSRSVDKIL